MLGVSGNAAAAAVGGVSQLWLAQLTRLHVASTASRPSAQNSDVHYAALLREAFLSCSPYVSPRAIRGSGATRAALASATAALQTAWSREIQGLPDCLVAAVHEHALRQPSAVTYSEFLSIGVPAMVASAVRWREVFPNSLPLLHSGLLRPIAQSSPRDLGRTACRVTLSPDECDVILSTMFLCGFERESRDCVDAQTGRLPSCNLDEMLLAELDAEVIGRLAASWKARGGPPGTDVVGRRRGRADDIACAAPVDENAAPEGNSVQLAKLLMFMDYFVTCGKRRGGGVQAANATTTIATAAQLLGCSNVSFILTAVEPRAVEAAVFGGGGTALPPPPLSLGSMCPAVVHPLFESIDEQHHMLRADFANSYIGGGVLAYGCVQEEITFSICPQLCCARLFTAPLQENEALLMVGFEQFSTVKPGTYAFTLQHGGAAPLEAAERCRQSSFAVAIDALAYRGNEERRLRLQCQPASLLRELVKATAGFALCPHFLSRVTACAHSTCDSTTPPLRLPADIATGNWGCGAFGGDVETKALVQWIACSLSPPSAATAVMHYFPFSNDRMRQRLAAVMDAVATAKVSEGPPRRELSAAALLRHLSENLQWCDEAIRCLRIRA